MIRSRRTSWSDGSARGSGVQSRVRPLREVWIVGEAALERDGFEPGAVRGLGRSREIAAVAVLHHFAGASQRAHFAEARDAAAAPGHAELEVAVGIDARRVADGRCHGVCSGRTLAGELLNPEDHELGGLQRRETDQEVDDALVDIVRRRGRGVALHEVRVQRCAALERALAEEAVHEGADARGAVAPRAVRRSVRTPPTGCR